MNREPLASLGNGAPSCFKNQFVEKIFYCSLAPFTGTLPQVIEQSLFLFLKFGISSLKESFLCILLKITYRRRRGSVVIRIFSNVYSSMRYDIDTSIV